MKRTTFRRPVRYLSIILTLCLMATFALCVSAYAETPKRGGTLIFARPDEPLTFDPFIPADNGSIWALEQVCDSLTEADATGEGLRPGLAESWTISEDGLTYTLKLRDTTFSNGKPVTAEDAIFSVQKIADPSTSYGFAFEPIESMKALDPKTIEIKLKSPYTPLLAALSLFSAAVVSKEDYLKDPDAFGQKPVCCGAFVVDTYERGNKVVLKKREGYWDVGKDGKPLPYLDSIDMRYVPESNSRVLGLRNKDFDVIGTVPFNQAKSVGAMPNVTLEVVPSYRLDYVYLNHKKAPIDNKKVRLAMNYAANREASLKAVYFSYGEIPNSYMPKINFHANDVEKIPYDIEKAKTLVKESGYDGTIIKLMVDTGNAPFRQIANILQQGWTEAGLKVEIVEYDVGTAFGMTEKGDYQAYVSYITSDINDTDELAILQADYTGGAHAFFSWYENDDVVKWLREARKESDPAKRAPIYAKVQKTVYWDGYSVPMNFVPSMHAYHDHVKGWQSLTTGWWWIKDVWVDK